MTVIIDYGLGNLASVAKAFEKAGDKVVISSDNNLISKADHLVLPGQGAFSDGINNIRKLKLDKIIYQQVLKEKKPILGICLGMQLMADKGYENGERQGLGLIEGETVKINTSANIRLPHIGWDDVNIKKKSPLFSDIPDNSDFYFLHSYYLIPSNKSLIVATCTYGQKFVVSAQKGNIFATLFHPEKSHEFGIKLIKNFLEC